MSAHQLTSAPFCILLPLLPACPPHSTANFNWPHSIRLLPALLPGGISQSPLLLSSLSGMSLLLHPCSITAPHPGTYSLFENCQLEVSMSTATVLVLTTLSSQSLEPGSCMPNEWVTCSDLYSTPSSHSHQLYFPRTGGKLRLTSELILFSLQIST